MNKPQHEQAVKYRKQKQMFQQMELESKAYELTHLINKHQISEQTVPSTLIRELENLQFIANRLIHQLKKPCVINYKYVNDELQRIN